jgi:hypothetical protein
MENCKDNNSNHVYFVDRFIFPKKSEIEFKERLNHNRKILLSLPGIIRFDAMEQENQEGNQIIMTIALWKNKNYINRAKTVLQEEIKRINFNPAKFYERLNVKVERNQFKCLN